MNLRFVLVGFFSVLALLCAKSHAEVEFIPEWSAGWAGINLGGPWQDLSNNEFCAEAKAGGFKKIKGEWRGTMFVTAISPEHTSLPIKLRDTKFNAGTFARHAGDPSRAIYFSYNDTVRSVNVKGGEFVVLFDSPNFTGEAYASNGTGCYDLDQFDIAGKVSSAILFQNEGAWRAYASQHSRASNHETRVPYLVANPFLSPSRIEFAREIRLDQIPYVIDSRQSFMGRGYDPQIDGFVDVPVFYFQNGAPVSESWSRDEQRERQLLREGWDKKKLGYQPLSDEAKGFNEAWKKLDDQLPLCQIRGFNMSANPRDVRDFLITISAGTYDVTPIDEESFVVAFSSKDGEPVPMEFRCRGGNFNEGFGNLFSAVSK